MRRELLMPKLGLTMTEGLVADWLIQPGQSFKAGESVFVVETDKVANEISADTDGILSEIVVPIGQSVLVGTVVGYWEDDQADIASTGKPPTLPTSQVANRPNEKTTKLASQAERHPVVLPSSPGTRIVATPLARHLARQRGIALDNLRGSGPNGRIVAHDVPQQAPARSMPSTANHQLIVPTVLQSTIAHRLTQSKQEIPHFYLAREAEVSRLKELHHELNSDRKNNSVSTLVRLTLNHFIMMAVARAMHILPWANRVWTQDGILAFGRVDVGIAVSTKQGLVAPAVCDVGNISIGELAQRIDAVVARAHANALLPQDIGNPTITVSNAGMHNVTYMTSIINPGQAMILGVGSIREVFRPDVEGKPILKNEMGLVLSVDHRIMDGVSALRLLDTVVGFLEWPARLLVI